MFENVITRRAAASSWSPALVHGGRIFSFGEMALDLRRCVQWLTINKCGSKKRAAIQVEDPYAYWVLFFALEAVGVCSISVYAVPLITQQRLDDLGADILFASHVGTGVATAHHTVNRAWFSAVSRTRAAPVPARIRRTDDPVCIVLSSGTTGVAKKVLIERGLLDARLSHAVSLGFADAESRVLSAIGQSSIGGLMTALGVWSAGGTLCCKVDAAPWEQTLRQMRVNLLSGAPVQVAGVLRSLPEDFSNGERISWAIGGGSLPKSVAAEVKRRFGGEVMVTYGTTETGTITQANIELLQGAEDAAGFVVPPMEVELVDDAGEAVPQGMLGSARVRGPLVVSGYLEDDDQTNKSFRGGWYYPGDVGSFDLKGVLRILGRADDLMNFGGVKVLPSTVEEIALRSWGVDEAAAFSVTNGADDIPSLWVVFVRPDPLTPRDVRKFKLSLRNIADRTSVARIPAVPRNMMGKVDRVELRRQALAGELEAIDGGSGGNQ